MKSATRTIIALTFVSTALSLPHVAAAAPSASCTVTNATLAFGNYYPLQSPSNSVTSSTVITISCSPPGQKNLPVTIQLSAGLYGVIGNRKMQDAGAPTDTLIYHLYSNSGYSVTWGNSIGVDTVTVTTNTGNPATATATIYGKIDASQNPQSMCPGTPCNYSDTVGITINW